MGWHEVGQAKRGMIPAMRTIGWNVVRLTVLGVTGLLATGCVERTISITSEPSGALVYLNDEEIGRTPCETAFLHYGTYDVRIIKDGYEPYMGPQEAKVPLYDLPGPDLVADLLPVRIRSHLDWHFVLRPVVDDDPAMIDRARQLRERMHRTMGDSAPTEEATPADSPAPVEGGI